MPRYCTKGGPTPLEHNQHTRHLSGATALSTTSHMLVSRPRIHPQRDRGPHALMPTHNKAPPYLRAHHMQARRLPGHPRLTISEQFLPQHPDQYFSGATPSITMAPTMAATVFRAEAFQKLNFAINNGYAPQTARNYNAAVKRYVHFAASCGVPEEHALPAPDWLLCLFAASGLGRTGPENAKNNISAIAAWHAAHNLPFTIPPQLRVIKRALRLHWPLERQQKPPRPPVSPQMIHALSDRWQHGNARERCALAIALSAWTGQMRLGELLPPNLTHVDRKRLPTRAAWSTSTRVANSSTIKLPWSKTTGFKGETVFLLHQHAQYDPTRAIIAHFSASRLMADALICEFLEDGKITMLDKQEFLAMCNNVWHGLSTIRFTGHSFRIGGTTALLRSGIQSEIVKKMGRWSSDAYLRYWRNVEELFADHASAVNWIDL